MLLTTTTHTMNLIMAMYLVYLSEGHTLQHKRIHSCTIKAYLLAAATFIQLCDHYPHRDARKADNATLLCPAVARLLANLKRFEDIPNKKEAYTLAMQKELYRHTRDSTKYSLALSLFQWFGVTLQGGNCRSEWCQIAKYRSPFSWELSPKNTCRAFTLGDVQFLGCLRNQLLMVIALAKPQEVHHV